MSNVLQRLAGSKVWSYIGLLAVALGVVCNTNRADIETMAPEWGPRICAGLVVAGAIVSALGQGIASRRPGPIDSGEVTPLLGIEARRTAGERKHDA